MSEPELKNIKKKKIYLKGPLSNPSKKVLTSVQAETETPEQTLSESTFFTLDDGSHFEASKLFYDRFSGKIVSIDSTVTCAHPRCGVKVYVEEACRVGGNYFCPKHKFLARLKHLFFGGLTERKEK
jgi:hypothetical protein